MKYFKIIILLVLSLFIYSCGAVKEGFSNQKKNSSDEFLVEKKAPLVMPTDYKDLPKPTTNQKTTKTKTNFRVQLAIFNEPEKNMKPAIIIPVKISINGVALIIIIDIFADLFTISIIIFFVFSNSTSSFW